MRPPAVGGLEVRVSRRKRPQCGLDHLNLIVTVSCNTIRSGEGAVAQSVERATPGEGVPGSIPVVAAPSRCQYNVAGWDRSHGLPALSHVWKHVKLSHALSWARPRYNLAVDEDVKNPTNQPNKSITIIYKIALSSSTGKESAIQN